MDEDDIKIMHEYARRVLDTVPSMTVYGQRVSRNIFRQMFWGLEPEEALRIGGNK